MGLLAFGKPKWRHRDASVRLESIAGIDPQDTDILLEISRQDQDREE